MTHTRVWNFNLKSIALGLLILGALCSCSNNNMFSNNLPAATGPAQIESLEGFPNNPAFWQANTATVWNNLQHISLPQLQTALTQTTDPTNVAWIKLAIISKQYSTNTPELAQQIQAWRTANPGHPAVALIPNNNIADSLKTQSQPKHFALLLPLQGSLASSGQAVRDGFLSAYYQAPADIKSQQTVSFYDTSSSTPVTALYQKAVADGADAVIGPLTKENVQALVQAGNFPVTTVALNYTDIWFGSLPRNLYEFGLSPVDEAKQVADHAWQAGKNRALIIAPQDAWGQRVSKTLTTEWQGLGGSVADSYYFNGQADLSHGIANLLHADTTDTHGKNNRIELEHRRRQDFNVIFLLARPDEARQIVPLIKFYYADNIPIYATSAVYSGARSSQDSDLNGVTFSDIPWVLKSGGNANRLYAVGRDAYLIATQIKRFDTLSNFSFYGATGALNLTPQHQIYRRLPWAQMHDGHT